MSDIDFDRDIDRRGTASVKWDRYGGSDVLPLWVADMDFAAPDSVTEALSARVRHGVFGYTQATDDLVVAIRRYLQEHHGWQVDPAWLVWLPGAVPALHAACRLTSSAARVVTSTPIYPPFLAAPRHMGRESLGVPLAAADGRAVLDLAALDRGLAQGAELFFFCNPHNPTGRVFTPEELRDLADCLLRHNVFVVADELHCDLVLEPGRVHRPLALVSPEIAERSITLYAPSKTFNLAGLGFAYAVIPNPDLRRRFRGAIEGILPYVNVLGYTAAEAAYRQGRQWRDRLVEYLRANRDRVSEVLETLPTVRARAPEGTYLYWMDLRSCGWVDPIVHLERHGLGLSAGAEFGAPGYARLNFACPRATLDRALERLCRAMEH